MPSSQTLKQLHALLDAFEKGRSRSLQDAREIEGFIASHFPQEHPLQELAEGLAQYQPGGGDLLYSEAEILPRVSFWLQRIRTESIAP